MISILYVDDEPVLLDLGKIFLEKDGEFTVETVISAPLALEAMHTKKFDAVISDYQMPGMDGIEFLKRVRTSGDAVPFIIFTGKGREEIVIQALNEGADFYLQKGGEPVPQFAELAHKVRKAVLQRKAEASVRDHERREVDIINFLPDATFAIDAKGTVITWNLAMERMTGVRAMDIIGKGDHEYSLPFYHEHRPLLIDFVLHDDPTATRLYPDMRVEGRRLFAETTIPHFNDGKGAELWFTASPLYDGQGNIIGAIESIREITERKRAEEALNESEQRFRELADLLPQIVYEADADGNLIYVNRIAFDLFGYTKEEFARGVTILQMIAPADRQRAEEALSDMLSGTQQVRQGGEYLAQRKDGSTFPVSIYSSLVVKNGRITGHRGIVIDITASRKAEEALSESEEKYRLVVENSHDAIYIHRNDRLLFANQRASEISGYTADELLTMNLWDLVHPDDRARLQDAARRRFAGEEVPAYFTARIIGKSGEVRDGGFFVDLVIYQGTPAIIGIVRDITEQKRAEEALRKSEDQYRRSDQFLREVINSAGEGIIVYDRDLRITLWNQFMEELTGISAADIRGKIATEIFSFLVDVGIDTLLRQALAGATVISPDIRFRIPSSGREGWSKATYSPHYGADGEIIGVIATIRDITPQKRAEEARQQSEVRFRSLIQNASDMIHILDREGKIMYESPSAEKIMGCPAGANTGIDAMMLVHPDDRERARADLLEVYDHTNPGTPTEFRLKKADGTFAWVESVATNLLDLPAVNGIVVTTRPIVQWKELETALRESEARYRNVVEDQTEFICRFLPDGTHVFVNGAYCRYFGLDRERILGTQFKPAIPPDDASRLGKFFASLTPAHPVDFIEHRTIMPDGTTRWQRWSDRAIFDASGNLIEYQSVGRDTTETKTVQDALRESETLYRSLSEASNDLIYVIDRAGRVTYLNSSAAAMFGRPAGELIGREWKSFFPENVAEQRGAVLRRVFESGKQVRSRSELPFGGRTFRLDHSLVPIRDAAGTVTEILGVSRDIGDLLRAEDDIREANKKMNLLTRITRHDVANQVSILKGYIRMALMRRPDPVVAEFLGKIDAAGTAINRQIEFTKMYQELGLRSPAWSAVRDLVARQRAAGFAVSCTCDAEVLADPLIERVFFNLCDNAVRHGERVTAITVRCGPGPDGLVILVEDNGTGVPPDLKTKIFEKGFGRNTGYGLFLAREILAITGITICETGVPGTGARFELHVPEGKYRLAGNG